MDFPIFDVDEVVEELLSDSSSDEDNVLGFSDLSPDSGHGSPNSAVSLSSDTSPYSDFRWESTSETLWDAISDDMASVIPLMDDHDPMETVGGDIYELTSIKFNAEQTEEEGFVSSQQTEILPQNDSDVVNNITVDVDWPMDMTFLDNPVKQEPISPVTKKEEPKEEATLKVCKPEVKQNIHKGAVILNTSLKGGSGQGLTGILLKPVKNGNVTTYITVPVSFTSVKENEKVEVKEVVKEIVKSKPPDKPQPLEEEKKIGNFSVSQGVGPNLVLTMEEKRLLDLEGYSLPTDMPLTKAEEKVLKKVRRKIKNKQSAMESRRRRKDYIDNLEKRVKDCTDKNAQLKKQVSSLTDENKSLASQLKELQALLAGSLTKAPTANVARSAQTGTCLAVLLLSFALFVFPFNPFTSTVPGKTNVLQGVDPYAGAVVRSRTLLQVDDNAEYDYHEDSNESDVQTLSSLADSLKFLQLGQSPLKGQLETEVFSEPTYRGALYFESSTQNSQDIILAFGENANQTEQRTLQ